MLRLSSAIKLSDLRYCLKPCFALSLSLSAEPCESALTAVVGMRSAACIFAPPPTCNNGISILCHGIAQNERVLGCHLVGIED
jgi:hypothetical protein